MEIIVVVSFLFGTLFLFLLNAINTKLGRLVALQKEQILLLANVLGVAALRLTSDPKAVKQIQDTLDRLPKD